MTQERGRPLRRRLDRVGCILAVLLTGTLLAPRTARAQSAEERCATLSGQYPEAQQYCDLIAQAAEMTQSRLGIGLAGGTAIPGTASTLGLRIGGLPRISVDARASMALSKVPDIRRQGSTGQVTWPLGSLDADAAVGVFQGFSPAPTVGGMFSLDLLGSVGVVPVPSSKGFQGGQPVTWALGARLGLLRESFLLPGVSVSAMYRRLGTISYGDSVMLKTYDAYFSSDLRDTSLRLAVSKNLTFVGLAGGIGYDTYRSDVGFGFKNPTTSGPPRFDIPTTTITSHRTSFFGDVSLNFVLLNLVGEIGWQNGGALPTVPLPPGTVFNPKKGALFGGVSLRLTI